MDQIKIGRFICKCRKKNNLTQEELAEKIRVSNRSVSKWENGICMPDSSIILELCKILGITINDLFSGEVVDIKDNEKRLENNLFEMIKLKEQNDRQLLGLEIFIGVLVSIVFIALVFVASFINIKEIYRILLIVVGFIIFMVGCTYCLRIEQTAGYYECMKCHHKYIPTFSSVLFAMHINRTRYMKCPKCNKKSWNKKVLIKSKKSNNEENI